MRKANAYEVHVRLRLRVLAGDEEEATAVVSAEVADRLTALLEELHGANPRLAGFCVHADDLVEEL